MALRSTRPAFVRGSAALRVWEGGELRRRRRGDPPGIRPACTPCRRRRAFWRRRSRTRAAAGRRCGGRTRRMNSCGSARVSPNRRTARRLRAACPIFAAGEGVNRRDESAGCDRRGRTRGGGGNARFRASCVWTRSGGPRGRRSAIGRRVRARARDGRHRSSANPRSVGDLRPRGRIGRCVFAAGRAGTCPHAWRACAHGGCAASHAR